MPIQKPAAPGLGTNLRLARSGAGLTLEKAALQLGVSAATLSRVERGITTLRSTALVKACSLYNLTVSTSGVVPAIAAVKVTSTTAPTKVHK